VIGFSFAACDDGNGGDDSITIGDWTFKVYNDNVNGGTSTITMTRSGNNLIVSGNLTKDCENGTFGYSGLEMRPNSNLLTQLRNATGFFFDIIGDGNTYFLQAITNNITDYGYFRKDFTTTNGTLSTISIPFSDLKQPAWAIQKPETHSNSIIRLEITVDTEVTALGEWSFTLVAGE
jgi:hypothetical protein